LKRRDLLALAAAPVLLQRGAPQPSSPSPGSIFVCMHQTVQATDPFELAMKVRATMEPLIE
jgi:hypothetical protein